MVEKIPVRPESTVRGTAAHRVALDAATKRWEVTRLDYARPVLPVSVLLDILTGIDGLGWPMTTEKLHALAHEKGWLIEEYDHGSLTLTEPHLEWADIDFVADKDPVDGISVYITQGSRNAPDPDAFRDLIADTFVEYTQALRGAFGTPIRVRNTPNETSMVFKLPRAAAYRIETMSTHLVSRLYSPEATADPIDSGNILAP